MDITLLKQVGAIACLLVANTILGVADSGEEFDWKILLKGIGKYLLILIAVAFIYGAGMLVKDIQVEILGTYLTILQLLSVVSLAIIGVYAIKCYKHLLSLFGLTDEDIKPYINNEEAHG